MHFAFLFLHTQKNPFQCALLKAKIDNISNILHKYLITKTLNYAKVNKYIHPKMLSVLQATQMN